MLYISIYYKSGRRFSDRLQGFTIPESFLYAKEDQDGNCAAEV